MLSKSHNLEARHPLVAFGVRRRGCLTLGVNLQDSGTSDNLLVGEVGARLGEDDVNLPHGSFRDHINLIVLVPGCDSDLNGELQE